MKDFMVIFFSAILVNNYVLSKFMGICPFLGVSKKLDSAVGMSGAVTFVLLLASAVTYPIYYLLDGMGIAYMRTVVFILIIASLVQLVEMILKKFIPALHKSLGIYLPLITTNCAVLGAAVLNIEDELTFAQAMVNALGAGAGFLLAMVLFCGVRTRIENSNVPKSFQGIPVTLIAAAIVSMSFMGFGGVIEGIFQ